MGQITRSVAAVAFAVTLGGVAGAHGQGYPSRPITMIVSFPAGGSADVIARIVAERMRVALGQTIVIENVSGASGSIGVGRVARAAPDGATIGLGSWTTHVLNGVAYDLKYDLINDFEPIGLIATQPLLVLGRKSLAANDLRELIAWLKANPDTATQGTAGAGATSHIAGVFFQKESGTRFRFVPYRGGNLAMQDLLAGQIDLMIDLASNSLPPARAGTVKAFAVTASTRLASAPDIPTVDEAGLPGFHVSNWFGLWAPKGTPGEAIGKLNAAVVGALADPAVRARLGDLGQELVPREQQTPEALRAFNQAEIERWWPIIRAATGK